MNQPDTELTFPPLDKVKPEKKVFPYALCPTLYSLLLTPYFLLPATCYLLLALCYFFIVPIFEAPDEWTHTGHVKYIAEGNGLPVMLPGRGIWGGQQPPLYYAIGALLVQPFDLADFNNYLKTNKNPHASLGYALDPGNKNNFLHAPTENFPYQGLSLTVHMLRLSSMAYGLIALIFTYFAAFELFNSQYRQTQATFGTQASAIHNSEPKAPYGQFTTAYSSTLRVFRGAFCCLPANVCFYHCLRRQ